MLLVDTFEVTGVGEFGLALLPVGADVLADRHWDLELFTVVLLLWVELGDVIVDGKGATRGVDVQRHLHTFDGGYGAGTAKGGEAFDFAYVFKGFEAVAGADIFIIFGKGLKFALESFEPDFSIRRAVLDTCVLVLDRVLVARGTMLTAQRHVLSALGCGDVAVAEGIKV